MSNKRVLYKLAAKENAVSRERRKPLAQGRLICKPVAEASIDVHHETYNEEYGGLRQSHTDNSRRDLSALITAVNTQQDLPQTPRKETPHVSINRSPKQLKPSVSLDLSDTDSEVVINPKRHIAGDRKSSPDVLFAEASHLSNLLDQSEVELKVGYTHSPVKVICHAPSVVHGDLRNTGDVEKARHVVVDQVPSVAIASDHDALLQLSEHQHKSPAVIREKSMAGGWVEQSNTVKQLFKELQTEKQDSKVAPKARSVSISQDDSKRRSVNISQDDSKRRSVTISQDDSKRKDKVKKKKPYKVISSRYMNAPAPTNLNKKGPMKATDRTMLGNTRTSSAAQKTAASSSHLQRIKTNPGPRSTLHAGGLTTSRSRTPDGRCRSQTKKASSTPTADAQPLGGMDVSAIRGVGQSTFYNSLEASSIESLSHSPRNHSSVRFRDSLKHSLGVTNKSDTSRKAAEEAQLHASLSYARYLQWVYVSTKAQKDFHAQEKTVMNQLYALWLETEKQEERKSELERELATLKHLNSLDDILDMQEKGLQPIIASLPGLKQQYGTLAAAVDTTRHQLPVRGVYMPDDSKQQQQYMDGLQHALDESEQLLGELSVMTRQQQPGLRSFSSALSTVESSVQEQVQQLDKVQELLSAAQSLTIQESSLAIQQIQSQHSP